jgi:hypothetical protein
MIIAALNGQLFLYSENPQFYWGFKKALAMSRKNKPPMLK